MRVLVIGGNGFIGSHVVDALLENGSEVVVLDRKVERFRSPLPEVKYFRCEQGNCRELENIISQGIEFVVHLASSTLPKTSNDHPIFDVQKNLVESLVLFDLCVKYKVRKVVFFSSGGTVYGVSRSLPIVEEHPTNPICSYGIVKLATEKYLQLYYHLHGLRYVILRVSNAYGIRQDPVLIQGVISVFMQQVLCNKPITIWGDGSIVRDFINVRDIANLCVRALSSDANGTFNLGSGVGVSVNQLVELISAALDRTVCIVREPSRNFDVPAIVLDCEKVKKVFSWAPRVALDDGLVDVANWLKLEYGRLGIDTSNSLDWPTNSERERQTL